MTITTYSRRSGEYLFDIEIGDTNWLDTAQRFFAQAVNIVRLESGQTVSVNADLPRVHGPTRHEVVVRVEATVAAWVTNQGRER
jgi:hypothetical protein